MRLLSLPPDEAAVRRYVQELWLPYHRELEAVVADHALADDLDPAAEVDYRLERLEAGENETWIAVDDADDDRETDADPADVIAGQGTLAGFVSLARDEAPPVFDRPDRLVVGDVYVSEPHRGTGLADDLLARAERTAREADCPQLALDVDADNERALAFYRRLGFEVRRHRMTRDVDRP